MKSPLQAIKEKCIECSGGSTEEVLLCNLKDCPLYAYRTALIRRKGKVVTEEENAKD